MERIIPTRDDAVLSSNTRALASGARCPAYAWNMLHIALLWSVGIWAHRILSTCRSAGSRNLTPTRVGCYLWKELFRRGIMGCYQVTLAHKIVKKPVIEGKMSLRGSSRCGFKRHSGNGKRGKIGSLSHSLFTRLIPAYVWNMPHIALRWSAGIWAHRILSTCRSAGSRNLTPTRVGCYLWIELFRRGIMGCYQVTLGQWQAGQDAPPTCGTCRTLRSAGAREIGRIAFYLHVNPLDRGNALRLE